ncbi:kugelei [Carabus blaptoides fortunei]
MFVELHKTGGGGFKKIVNETGERMLGMLSSQLKPLSNPFDSSANYLENSCTALDNTTNEQSDNIVVEIDESITTDNLNELPLASVSPEISVPSYLNKVPFTSSSTAQLLTSDYFSRFLNNKCTPMKGKTPKNYLNPICCIQGLPRAKKLSKEYVVADFGCGDARLSKSVPQKVHSFELVANDPSVTACDMAHVPLKNNSVDVAVFFIIASATSTAILHILDRNDNAPEFLNFSYEGSVSEAAPVNSLVLTNRSTPLVINAYDADSELNALMNFEIIEALPKKYFHIDSSTGAVRTVRLLDRFVFHVKLTDRGKPRLSSESTAQVQIIVNDINDCAPRFTHHIYNVTLLLPTYKNVAVIQLNATDPDSEASTTLRYDNIEDMKSMHRLQVRVSDGKFSNIAKVDMKKKLYEASVTENSTKITTVCVVNVLGSALNEHVEFTILNPTDMFEIGLTSGAIRSTGKRFDREAIDSYELIVETRNHIPDRNRPRVAHVIVNVTVFDINDNCPMFVNLSYYAVFSVDEPKGSFITKVHAVDMDQGQNGEVRYELIRGHGELFKVLRKTGDIEFKQSLEGHNKENELIIAAYDGGENSTNMNNTMPYRCDVTVHVKVIDRSMPVFKKQFYSELVPESVELHSPLALSVEEESPLGRKLIYSIVKSNELEEFALDFNTDTESEISLVRRFNIAGSDIVQRIMRGTRNASIASISAISTTCSPGQEYATP